MSRFAFIAAIVCAAPAFAETRYFAHIEDVPLPDALVELDAGWSMNVEAGQLTEARAEGGGALAAARSFYVETLPQLGWSASPQTDGSLVFVRGREQLMLSISAPQAGRVLLRVRLIVRSAAMNAD